MPNKYERLRSIIPELYDEIVEMQEILKAEAPELEFTYKSVDDSINAFFVRRTTDETIKYWERQFNVDLSYMPTLKEKQQEVLKLLLGFSKLSCSKIEEIVLTMTSYKSTSYVESSTIKLQFNDIGYPDEKGLDFINKYIEQLKPAHLGFEITFLFRTHAQLKPYTHADLKAYTHNQIKTQREDL